MAKVGIYDRRKVKENLARLEVLKRDPRYVPPSYFPMAGPLGGGVEFYMDDTPEELFDMGMLEDIQEDAYEAARDAIVSGIDAHTAQWVRHRHILDTIASL